MKQTLIHLWRDESGAASGVAMILLYTIVALGATVGLVSLRDQIVQEFGDVSAALANIDQSWWIPSPVGGGAAYGYTDPASPPYDTDPLNFEPAGLDVQGAPTVPPG